MILADTSAWVEYDRGTRSHVDQRMIELVGGGDELVVTEPIIMEIIIGARDDRRESELRRLMLRFSRIAFDAVVDFDGAARIYRQCRRAGVTPRGTVDCMIASVARRNGAALLSADADLLRVANIVGIEIEPSSLEI